jgi:large repetitive protein
MKLFIKLQLFVLFTSLGSGLIAQTVTTDHGNFTGCTGGIQLYTYDFTAVAGNVINTNIGVNNTLNICCNYSNNASNSGCIYLDIVVEPGTLGVSFALAGATGSTSIYYENCGEVYVAGDQICFNSAYATIDPITGNETHRFMFCRSGATTYDLTITQILPAFPEDLAVSEGCTIPLSVTNLDPASIVWNTISPGAVGEWNHLLSCTSGCLNTILTPTSGSPSSITIEVCGSLPGACSASVYCSQSTVTIFPDLFADAGPDVAFCLGSTIAVTSTGEAIGGAPPFTYTWTGVSGNGTGFTYSVTSNSSTETVNFNQTGVYQLTVVDVNNCATGTDFIEVFEYATDIVAFVPTGNVSICFTPTPTVTIDGYVTETETGDWTSSNGGVFGSVSINSPGAVAGTGPAVSTTWTPTAGTTGTVTLTLTPTNNAGCPITPASVIIDLTEFTSTLAATSTDVDCNNADNGAIDLTITPGNPAYATGSTEWTFNGAAYSSTEDLTDLAPGDYSVTVTDINGCVGTLGPITIIEPLTPLTVTTTQVDVLCFGGTTGSIDLTPAGGTAPYTYLWSNGATTQDISGLAAGTYTVTVNDANGSTGSCTATTTVTITQPLAPLTVTTTQVDVLCFGGTTGSIDLTPVGGTAPYTYSWSNGATTQDISGLAAGTYTVIVNDANGSTGGCTATATVTITQPLAPLTVSTTQVDVLCFGGTTGSIDLTPVGGTAPYTYSWSNGATTEDLSSLAAGTYTVIVNDANGSTGGCTATTTVTITQPLAPLTVTTTQVDVLCFGGTTGSIDLTPAGGTAPYTYSWSNGATTQDISGLAAGTYTVIVNDANGSTGGCTATTTVTIIEPLAPLTVTTTQVNVVCFGGTTGSIDLTPAGGTAPYTYSWSNGATTEDISGLAAGTYTVIVNDANGSTGGCTATTTVTIIEPLAPLTVSTTQVNVVCFGGTTGSIDLTPVGGTAPYTYSWSNGATTEDLSGLAAGTYTVIVNDANGSTGGCTATTTVTITQPLAPLTVSTTQVNVVCFDGTTGSIDLTPAGGTVPYTYSWSNGATTEDLSGLAAGTYTVIVNDANGSTGGCTATATVTIIEPLAPLTVSTTQVNVVCFDGTTGSIDLTPAGGTAPYTYSWSNGATTEDLSSLPAGTYTVIVNDANGSTGGCTATTTVTIIEPLAPLTVTTTQVNVVCFGGTTGSIDLTPVGGTAPYTYSWSNGATTEDLSGLAAGTYTVIVNDANGSTGGCTATTTVTITQPLAPLTVTTTQVDILCFDGTTGSIDLTPAGGTVPYTYSWSNGATTEDLSGLAAGTYTVIVNDANGSTGGCTATATVTIIEPLAPLTVTTTQVDVLCFDGTTGSIDLTPAGGTAPYTYSWSNGATTEDLSGLAAGTYTVIVNDANGSTGGCTATTTVTIIEPLAPLTVTTTQVNVVCFGGTTGSIDLTPAGGTAPYTYSWSNGVTTEDLSGLAAGTYTVIVNDANGSTGGCTATTTVTIIEPLPLVVTINGDDILCFGDASGNVTGTITGGTAPYVITLNETGATLNVAADGDAYDFSGLSGLPSGGFDQYTVSVTDANGNAGGCAVTVGPVPVTEPLPLSSTLTPSVYAGGFNLSGCVNDGSIDLAIAGGSPVYEYSWTGPNGFTSTTEDLTDLFSGTYLVTVTDINGCILDTTITLTEPSGLGQTAVVSIFPSGDNVSCFGASDGFIDITTTLGTPNYTWSWTGPNGFTATTEDIAGVIAGSYTLTITDANNCSIDTTIVLTEPLPLVVTINGDAVLCNGDATGNVTGTITGGTAPYVITLDETGATLNVATDGGSYDFPGLVAGTYNVTVTDASGVGAGCLAINGPASVIEPLPLVVTINGDDILCFGDASGNVTGTITGGTAPYVITLNETGATLNVAADGDSYDFSGLDGLPSGGFDQYTVSVTDANGNAGGCALTVGPVPMTEPLELIVTINGDDILCFGDASGNVTGTITGGTAPYVVTLNETGATLNVATDGGTYDFSGLDGLPSGGSDQYTVSVTDANGTAGGCTLTVGPVPMTEPLELIVTINGDDILCFGDASGNVTGTITGGTAPYVITLNETGATLNVAADGDAYDFSGLDGLPSGGFDQYTVSVTDANGNAGGCAVTVGPVPMTEPLPLSSTLTPSIYAGGFNLSGCVNDGTIDLAIAGGSPGYTYSWTGPSGFTSTTEDVADLFSGTYLVTVTDDNGCILDTTITLTEPSGLGQTAVVSIFPSGDNVSCFGASDGFIDITTTLGTPNYTWSWTGPNGFTATTEDIAGVIAGSYTLTITDANNCSIDTTIILTEPLPLVVTINGDAVLCNGDATGNVTGTITGGTAPYIITLDETGATLNVATDGGSYDFPGLVAGTYNVTVTDASGVGAGCLAINGPASVIEPLPLVVTINGDDILCFGDASGNVTGTITGGTAPYVITLNETGATLNVAADGDSYDFSGLDGLPSGGFDQYTVSVTDANGNAGGCALTVGPVPMTEPLELIVTINGDDILCFGDASGNVTGTITGGTAPYVITLNETGATLNVATDGGTYDFSGLDGLPSGGSDQYTVSVTDANGNAGGCALTVGPVPMTEPLELIVTINGDDILCFGDASGNVTGTITGGTAPYVITLNETGATLNVAADGDAYDFSGLDGLPSGGFDQYTVSVTDANGNAGGCAVTVGPVPMTEPLPLSSTLTPSIYAGGFNLSGCVNDGTIDLAIAGGSPGYTYSWTGPSGFTSTTEDVADLFSGTYLVTVTDDNGCILDTTITLTEPSGLGQTAVVSIFPSGDNVSCFGASDGFIDITTTLGTPNYTWSWTGPNGFTATTEDIAGLIAGSYTLTITDANDCSIDTTIVLTEPTPLVQDITSPTYPSGDNISCFEFNDGSIDYTIGGGSPVYDYSWDNGSTTEDLTALVAGTYAVTVTDINGCQIDTTITLIQPTPLVQDVTSPTYLSGDNISCFEAADGTVDYTISGGSPGYDFSWNNGSTTEDLADLGPGTYVVTVTDINGLYYRYNNYFNRTNTIGARCYKSNVLKW